MTLKLLAETIVGIALTIGWWMLHFGILDGLESRRVSNRLLDLYGIAIPIILGIEVYFLLGRNPWFGLAIASPFWFVYGVEGVDKVDVWANRKARRGGDYVWYAVLVIILAFLIYVISPLNAPQIVGNLVGLVLGIACGAITGTFLAIGALIGLKWKAHRDTGAVIGGAIGLLVPMLLLTIVFDLLMLYIPAPIGLRLYVVAFLPICVLTTILVGERLEEKEPVVRRAEGQA